MNYKELLNDIYEHLKTRIKGNICLTYDKGIVHVYVSASVIGVWQCDIPLAKVKIGTQSLALLMSDEILKQYKISVYKMYFY